MYEDEGSVFWDDERQAHDLAERSTTPEQRLMNDIQVLREMVYDLRRKHRNLKEEVRRALEPIELAITLPQLQKLENHDGLFPNTYNADKANVGITIGTLRAAVDLLKKIRGSE